jgi:ABC-2 type transport system permease protein
VIPTIAGNTLHALLSRRRALLMAILAAVPVLVALLGRAYGEPGDIVGQTAGLLQATVLTALLPLVALVFGTAALGAELEDGSAIHLLTKPVARWRVVAGKVMATVPLTALLVGVATLITGMILGGDRGAAGLTLAYTLAAAVGGLVYVMLFVALSVLTGRALIVGLIYVVVWEGTLAGLFDGTRILSIRQYLVGLIAAVDPRWTAEAGTPLAPETAVAGVVLVTAVSFLVAVQALERHQVNAGD